MLRATTIVRRPAVRPERVADTLTLGHAERSGRPANLISAGGVAIQLDLDKPAALDDGDAVKLEDGRLVAVQAAPERLLQVTAGTPARLARVAWHLGGAHVPTEIGPEALFVPHDPGTAELVRGLGAASREVSRPFRPERAAGHHHHHGEHDGAHGAESGCGHDHGHHHHHAHGGGHHGARDHRHG